MGSRRRTGGVLAGGRSRGVARPLGMAVRCRAVRRPGWCRG
jgi:hypothetical protein